MTAAFSDVLNEAIKKSEIQMNFKGFAMGDSWISPVDSVSSWGPYLFGTSIVDNAGLEEINKAAQRVEDLVKAGEWREATNAWSSAEVTVGAVSSNVNFYNIMDWRGATMGLQDGSKSDIDLLYARHVKPLHNGDLNQLMNGPIKRKLKIIPDSVEWGGAFSCSQP
ncbi:retinoid-inducible serine carboxypeptidase-like [Aplysia californica]|uniref:Retinoid-inducible serine carboxypeptidase-like n=1 Tax=Aplysia californica TaxID=6500 RepID=A0ABM0K4G8_APLCA|nr:retinoid-inducible serine carboxypeptidase-like [Aplysia californica]